MRAAEKGQKFAQYYVGRKYARGEGVPPERAAAMKWLTAAAEKNHAFAQFELARLLESSDCTRALALYRASAERGHVEAQFRLAALLDRIHPDEARNLLRALPSDKPAEPTPADAESVRRWEREQAEAGKWYRAAAENGKPRAQFYRGMSETDDIEALKWLYLVAVYDRQDPFEGFGVDGLYQAISERERAAGAQGRAEAERRARKWLSQRPARDSLRRLLMEPV